MRVGIAIVLLLAGTVAGQEEPRKTDITERVDVQLVLLDVTVLAKDRSIVTGLTAADFVLRLDHEQVPIVSLDMACPDEPVAEPPAVEAGTTESTWRAPDRERTIVFAVDYRHLEQTQRIEVLRNIADAIRRLHTSRERVMIVALADFLRVELTPTNDAEEALAALERMENDPSLWLPPFDHLHDLATFESLDELTGLLGALENEKTVVLFSNWPSTGFNYDVAFEKLVRRAARFRVNFYTVWARGLQARGTSRNLARLAMETGGRFTERTNDFSLGYARAQRDASCRYTVGFHDSPDDPDRTRRVDLRVNRRGVRVYHHDLYAPEDREAAPAEVAQAALAWPELYTSDALRVELLPLLPVSRKRWQAVFALEATERSEQPVHVRARLRRGNSRWTRTDEKLATPFAAAQPIDLRHGEYVSSLTAIWPGAKRPSSASTRVELPELDDDVGWWLAEPIVLRPIGDGPVDPAVLEGTALEGDPLVGRVPVLTRIDAGRELSLLQTFCRYGPVESGQPFELSLSVDAGDRPVFRAESEGLLPAGDGVHCERLDRRLPPLPPGRYVARATLLGGETESTRRREFEVLAPASGE